MKKILQTPFFVLVFLLPGLIASGQVKFTTVINSREIGRDETLQVQFTVENARQIDQITPPDFPGFQVVQGPFESSGTSVINNNISQYLSLSFVLRPLKMGKLVIRGASAMVDGKQMESNTVKVNIVAHSTGNGASGNNGNMNPLSSLFPSMNMSDPFAEAPTVKNDEILRPGENINDKIHKDLFLKVEVDKNTCYVGESIVATYKLYSRARSEFRVIKHPSLNGFSVYDMIDPTSDAAVSVEQLNGKKYRVHILRKTQLVPLQAGTVDLDPVEVDNSVHFIKGGRKQQSRHNGSNSLQGLFEQLNGDDDGAEEVVENVTLDTKPVPVIVKPLPEKKKPAGFGGAVGNFTVEASLANANVAAEDAATLHVVVKGRGNLPVVNAPQVQWPAGVEAFDPKAQENVNTTIAPMSGSKSFDYTFTVRNPGHYTIPAIDFSFFDPSSGSYKSAVTAPMELQVTPAVKKHQQPAVQEAASTTAGTTGGLKKFIQQYLEWIFAVIILSFVAVYLWRQNLAMKKKEEEQKAEAAKNAEREKALLAEKKSLQTAVAPNAFAPVIPVADPLQEARDLFERGDYKGFYRDVNRAVWKAIGRKLDLPASELNKSNVIRQLEIKGWDGNMTLSLESLLNECEMNLYTPAYDPYNMQQLLRQAEGMLGLLV